MGTVPRDPILLPRLHPPLVRRSSRLRYHCPNRLRRKPRPATGRQASVREFTSTKVQYHYHLDRTTGASIHEMILSLAYISRSSLCQPVISDSVVVWRAWALFVGQRWTMIGPILMLLATICTLENDPTSVHQTC